MSYLPIINGRNLRESYQTQVKEPIRGLAAKVSQHISDLSLDNRIQTMKDTAFYYWNLLEQGAGYYGKKLFYNEGNQAFVFQPYEVAPVNLILSKKDKRKIRREERKEEKRRRHKEKMRNRKTHRGR